MSKKLVLVTAALLLMGTSAYAVSSYLWMKEPVTFYAGHTHLPGGETVGAPGHSGGLDRKGCHNASVPYHCH